MTWSLRSLYIYKICLYIFYHGQWRRPSDVVTIYHYFFRWNIISKFFFLYRPQLFSPVLFNLIYCLSMAALDLKKNLCYLQTVKFGLSTAWQTWIVWCKTPLSSATPVPRENCLWRVVFTGSHLKWFKRFLQSWWTIDLSLRLLNL